MGYRDWRYYNEPDSDGIKLGRMASGRYDTRLVKSTCANYAQARRNILNLVYNIDVDGITLPGSGSGTEWLEIANINIGGRINRPGQLYIYLRTQSASELAANAIDYQVDVGMDHKEGNLANVSLGWRKIVVDLTGTGRCDPNERLSIRLKTRGTNTIDIHGVSCYQPGDSSAPAFVDLDDANCVLGDADFPDSVFAMKLLRDNCVSVKGWKVPKANVWCQWWRDWHKLNAAYGANNNDLGVYRFVKRAGISEVKCHFLAAEMNASGAQARLEITDPDGELAAALLPAAAQTVALTSVGLNPLEWYTVTWTFQGADVTNERNLELIIDARDTAGLSHVYIPGIYLVETAPSAVIAHTVPNVINVPMHSDIEAAIEHDNTRTTLNHLYYRGARQILIGDWRFAEYVSGAWVIDFLCQNSSWAPILFGNPATYGNTCLARGLLYSSTSSVKLRSRLEYSTDATTSATKEIQTALDDTFDRGIANYYEADPLYDLATNNIHQTTRVIDGTVRRAIELCELDIRAADWEEHYDGVNEPPQVHINARGNTTGYIIPHQYSCAEIELSSNMFP